MAEAMRQLATPDTESVRWWWIEGRATGVSRESAGAQFDRWLATARSPEPDEGEEAHR